MTDVPITEEQVWIVPANEASWDELSAVFGTTDAGFKELTHPTIRRSVMRIDF